MYICICYGITDSEIKQTIDNGANSREKIGNTIGAGTCCGRCCDELDRLLLENKKTAPVTYPQAVLYHPQQQQVLLTDF